MRQWDDRNCIIVLLIDEVSGDVRKDLWWHPVDWPQKVS
jgi:hypothetical protein